jgi:hypothetical protein
MLSSLARRASLVLALAALAAAGCTSPALRPTGDALLDLRNPNLQVNQRVDAVDTAWGEVLAGVRDRPRTREVFKDMAWSASLPREMRLAMVRALMTDESPEGTADSIRLVQLMLPSESDRSVARLMIAAAGQRGWTATTPSLVRSWARTFPPQPGKKQDDPEPDSSRVERVALDALHPGRTAEAVVFDTFLDPGEPPAGASSPAFRWSERVREDAWTLLSRLDPRQTLRPQLIASGRESAVRPEASAAAAALAADLRAAQSDLGVLPDSGLELAWLRRLRAGTDAANTKANAAWWAQATAAVAGLAPEQRRGLALRHVEPVRLAAAHRAELLSASRDALLAELAARLDGRERNARSADRGPSDQPRRERLADWSPQLSWADLLSVVIIDDAVRSAPVVEALFAQTDLDRKDTTTEYGGSLEADARADAPAFRAVLYMPRQGDRTSDEKFVASDDMMRYSDRALAHYHFHAQYLRNEAYAGPSVGDLDNAAASGRSSLVFTSITAGQLGVDLYTPDGVVLDLGTIDRATGSRARAD